MRSQLCLSAPFDVWVILHSTHIKLDIWYQSKPSQMVMRLRKIMVPYHRTPHVQYTVYMNCTVCIVSYSVCKCTYMYVCYTSHWSVTAMNRLHSVELNTYIWSQKEPIIIFVLPCSVGWSDLWKRTKLLKDPSSKILLCTFDWKCWLLP